MGLIVVALLVCLGESITKGWFSLLLIPASLAILPAEFFLQRWGIRTQRRLDSGYLRLVRLGQMLSLVVAYVTLVGFGDTDDVFLFGFMMSTLDSGLTDLSWTVFGLASTALPILTVWLIVALIRRRDD